MKGKEARGGNLYICERKWKWVRHESIVCVCGVHIIFRFLNFVQKKEEEERCTKRKIEASMNLFLFPLIKQFVIWAIPSLISFSLRHPSADRFHFQFFFTATAVPVTNASEHFVWYNNSDSLHNFFSFSHFVRVYLSSAVVFFLSHFARIDSLHSFRLSVERIVAEPNEICGRKENRIKIYVYADV